MRAIIGFDPGVTCGLAITNLEGEIVFLDSFRNKSVNQISEKITKVAQPLIVAADVSPAPDSVVKLSKSFGAVLFEPTISLTVEEKQTMTSGISMKDLHQRDALAAALAAYRAYRPLIHKTKQKTGSKYEKIVEKILKGKSSKIAEAAIEPAKLLPKKPSNNHNLLRRFKNLEMNRDHLAKEVKRLNKKNKKLSKSLKEVKSKLKKWKSKTYHKIAKNKKVQALCSRVSNLDKNQRRLFRRAKVSKAKLDKITHWLENRLNIPLVCKRKGKGLKVGDLILMKEPKSTIKKIIDEHRRKRS